ncbi:MAG: hypothetical protein ACI89L_000098 [Phycisphaerales bacterium]|jgi:hypothetical protein
MTRPGSARTFGQFFVGRVGDLTGDGIPDIYIGDYLISRAHVYSGADGSEHLSISGVSGTGPGRGLNADADGDGVPDLAVGAYLDSTGTRQGGQVRVISGADGSLIRTISGTVSNAQLGFDAVGLGDINGDGIIDNGDIGAFVALFLTADSAADLNSDGIIDNSDIGAFITLFLAGC